VFDRTFGATSELEAALKVAIYLEDESVIGWDSVARQFINDHKVESAKEFDGQKKTVKDILMRTMIELPRNREKKVTVLEIMELKRKYAQENRTFPRRTKKRTTPELSILFGKCEIFDVFSSICNSYVFRLRAKIVKIVKENEMLNRSPEDHAKEQQRRQLVAGALLLYKAIHYTHQPTAIHWTPEQCELLNLDDSDKCGISGYVAASDLIRVFLDLGVLKAGTYFLDVGGGLGHVVFLASTFGVKCSIGVEVHFPTVATSVAAFKKITRSEKHRSLLRSPVILHEGSAAYIRDVSPVDVVFSFIGCDILAKYVAQIVTYSESVETVVLVYTHSSYLIDYGFLGDGDLEDQDASNLMDHISCGSASMPGGNSYQVIALLMTPHRRQRMRTILESQCFESLLPDEWAVIKECIDDEATRTAYMDNYIRDHFEFRPLLERAKHAPVTLASEYVPSSSSSSSSSSCASYAGPSSGSCVGLAHATTSKKRKASGKASEDIDREALLARIVVENASHRKQHAARVAENASLKKQVEDLSSIVAENVHCS